MRQDGLLEKIVHMTGGRAYSIHYTTSRKEWNLALYMHMHTEFEFLYLRSGSMDLTVGKRAFHMNPGDAVLIPSGVVHYAVSEEICEFGAVVFSDRFLIGANDAFGEEIIPRHLYASDAGAMLISAGGPGTWEDLILGHLVELLYHRPAVREDMFVYGHLMLIWQLMQEHVFVKAEDAGEPEVRRGLLDSIRYMEHFFARDIRLEQLADAAGMSISHYCRQFRGLTDQTPIEYLNRYRIMKCCEYLDTTTRSIKEICYDCGFNNISYFNRAFKKEVGCTPGEYREGQRSIDSPRGMGHIDDK